MSDSADIARVADIHSKATIIYWCGEPAQEEEFYEGIFFLSPRWGNA